MKNRQRTASAVLAATALSLALTALPGTAQATAGAEATELTRAGYWPLDAAPDGTAANVEPGGQPLTLHGNASVHRPADPLFGDPALVGEGDLRLDGDGDWAETAAPPITGDGSFTVAVRARPAVAGDTTQTVLSLPGTEADRLAIRYQAATGRWEAVVATEDKATAQRVVITDDQDLPSTDPNGVGDHLALVYDAAAHELRFYVNAQLTLDSTVPDHATWPAASGLQVGRSLIDGQYFQGTVDEVRAYTGAANATKIAQMAGLVGLPDL
jgi:hypothetical protein